jgi:hypothetical protein
MKQQEIETGKVYTNTTSENRRVLNITTGADGVAMVRYQAMPWTMNPEQYLTHFKHLAPLPSPAEFRNKARIAPGVLYADMPLDKFARWAKQERQPHAKLNAPGQTMAAQVIEIVMRKQYTSRSAERTFYSECSTREQFITLGPSSVHWVYTMPDGSRIGFMAPVVMAELDDIGRPVLTSHHQLDLNQSFAFGDIPKIARAEERLWIEANRPFA